MSHTIAISRPLATKEGPSQKSQDPTSSLQLGPDMSHGQSDLCDVKSSLNEDLSIYLYIYTYIYVYAHVVETYIYILLHTPLSGNFDPAHRAA